MLDVKPLNSSSNELFTEFWETLFSCKFNQLKSSVENQRECTGYEDVTGMQNSFTDILLMPIFYNVYKALSLRHCLHLNVNNYIYLCKFQKRMHIFSKQQFIFALKNHLLNIFVVFTVKNLTFSYSDFIGPLC